VKKRAEWHLDGRKMADEERQAERTVGTLMDDGKTTDHGTDRGHQKTMWKKWKGRTKRRRGGPQRDSRGFPEKETGEPQREVEGSTQEGNGERRERDVN
jgi:hypothetical protein